MRRFFIAVVATGAAGALGVVRAVPAAAQTPSAATNPATETPEQAIQRDLAQQTALLTSPNSRPELREQAAERLVARDREDARGILLNVLSDTTANNRPARIAAARALGRDPRPDPRFVQPLLGLLDRDIPSTEGAVSGLIAYRDNADVLNELINFARNPAMVPKSRVAAVRGIGSFVKKNAAAFLIGLVNNADEESQVRTAAFEALATMTGMKQIGHDVPQWNAWWASTREQPDTAWQNALNAIRAGLYDVATQDLQRLSDEAKIQLERVYQRAPEAQRAEMVLSWLSSREPMFKVLGADIVYDQTVAAARVPAAIVERLREMIGDSSFAVRKEVIIALREINDPASIDPLLAQLAVEPEPVVKIAIASALARLQNVRAIESLVALLNDPSSRVVESAAEALRGLGEQIRKDPVVAARVSVALRAKLDAVSNRPATDNIRGALLEALAPLRDDGLLRVYSAALNPDDARNTEKVRIAACKGLSNMTGADAREQAAAELVAALRRDPYAGVRLEAARALESVGTFAQAEPLFSQMDPRREPDKSVRDMAWTVLTKMFERPEVTPATLLNNWVDRFKNDLPKKVVVQQVARRKLEKRAKDPQIDPPTAAQVARLLATVNQDVGDTQLSLEQWEAAAASFRSAMQYWQDHGGGPAAMHQLSKQRMTALLRAGNYTDAVQFAAEQIAADPQEERGNMGHLIRVEVERLRGIKDLARARALVDETLKVQLPLGDPYANQIRQLGEDLKERSSTQRPDSPTADTTARAG